MTTTRSKRPGLAIAAALGAIGVSLLIPSIARPALPNPVPAGITIGGLHLTPSFGTGGELPGFLADGACAAGTNQANVNVIDPAGLEQQVSGNVAGPVAVLGHFTVTATVDMATIQSLAGAPGTAEPLLFLVDCRPGVEHGTYTDAVQVDYAADGSWVVHGTTPGSPSPSASPSASASPSGSPSPSATPSPTSTVTETQTATPGPSASSSAPGGAQLPVTGPYAQTLTGVALALIAVGAGLRYAARRRRHC